jgi:hypothetical protein
MELATFCPVSRIAQPGTLPPPSASKMLCARLYAPPGGLDSCTTFWLYVLISADVINCNSVVLRSSAAAGLTRSMLAVLGHQLGRSQSKPWFAINKASYL